MLEHLPQEDLQGKSGLLEGLFAGYPGETRDEIGLVPLLGADLTRQ